MAQFIKSTIATVVGIFAFLFLAFFLIWAIIPDEDIPEVKENSVLHLNLNLPIAERTQDNPLAEIGGDVAPLGLLDILAAIKEAKSDEKIKGIYINTQMAMAGFASLEEIRNALIDFKTSKKFIVAYAEYYSEGAYYLASVADRIYLNPIGLVELNGLSSEVTFIKGALEKLEVKPLIFKVGDYKSAVEPLILDKMSDANREQVTSYLNSIYDFYLKNVSESRNIALDKLTMISDSMLIRKAEDALTHNLVTNIGYEDEAEEDIRKTLKVEKDKKVNYASLKDYIKVVNAKAQKTSSNRITVIVAEGEIVDGKGDENSIGSSKFVEEIKRARNDDKVKAVVLRINSPGGSALASDVMWREIQLLKKEKPVIASMSDVAASGGYYMAMGCDTIVAQPNTITGSIGIFGVLFNAQDLLKNKLGVTTDRVTTGKYSDLGSPTREMTKEEMDIIQKSVERGYETFTGKAAEGRKMNIDDLKKIASGRVWSGAQAKENGLIDVFGGIDTAIEIAAKKAKLGDDYMVKYYPRQEKFFDKILNSMSGNETKMVKKEMGEFYQYYEMAKKLKNLNGIQARMPFDVVIR